MFFLFSTQKKTSDVCSDQIGGEKNPGLSQFIAQEVLSLLRGLASAVWHDYGGGPDFDRRLEEAAPRWLPTGQAINWFGLVGCDEGMIASNYIVI